MVALGQPAKNKDHGVNTQMRVEKLHGFVITIIRTPGLLPLGFLLGNNGTRTTCIWVVNKTWAGLQTGDMDGGLHIGNMVWLTVWLIEGQAGWFGGMVQLLELMVCSCFIPQDSPSPFVTL